MLWIFLSQQTAREQLPHKTYWVCKNQHEIFFFSQVRRTSGASGIAYYCYFGLFRLIVVSPSNLSYISIYSQKRWAYSTRASRREPKTHQKDFILLQRNVSGTAELTEVLEHSLALTVFYSFFPMTGQGKNGIIDLGQKKVQFFNSNANQFH